MPYAESVHADFNAPGPYCRYFMYRAKPSTLSSYAIDGSMPPISSEVPLRLGRLKRFEGESLPRIHFTGVSLPS